MYIPAVTASLDTTLSDSFGLVPHTLELPYSLRLFLHPLLRAVYEPRQRNRFSPPEEIRQRAPVCDRQKRCNLCGEEYSYPRNRLDDVGNRQPGSMRRLEDIDSKRKMYGDVDDDKEGGECELVYGWGGRYEHG